VLKPKTTNEGKTTMTRPKLKDDTVTLSKQELMKLLTEEGALKGALQVILQEVLECEMEQSLQAAKGERTGGRQGYRSGYYGRSLITRVGKLELRVPQDRQGRFSTELFARYQRSEKALVAALMTMYVQGVSTRRVKLITEELCGHEFSASAVSAINAKLDEELHRFFTRRLEDPFAYLILDARYERVREDGLGQSRAVQIALGVGRDGRRQVLAVELAAKESTGTWKTQLLGLKERGLHGVQVVVSDDHPGLKRAIMEVLPEARWQRCYVHFLRNARDQLGRRHADDCITELTWLYERHAVLEARTDLTRWLERWSEKHPKLCTWVEANIEETFTFFLLPREHHKHLRSTNMLERLNQELKRRTLLVRIFPDETSCLRLSRALAIEIHEQWVEENRYLNMGLLAPERPGQTQAA
jgi:putative transposase